MPIAEDLLPADVQAYTKGVLLAADPETQRALDTALDRARRFAGWHISPVKSETFNVRGGGWSYIVLPTLKIASITSITEDGETVDLADVEQYSGEPGVIYKKCGVWCGRIVVTVQHGFTAAEAAGFRGAVLALIDRAAQAVGTGGSGTLSEHTVDDVTLRWNGLTDRMIGSIAKEPLDESVLYQYRLLPFA